MKQTIRLNENQLKQIVTEAVKKILKEEFRDRYLGDNDYPSRFGRTEKEREHSAKRFGEELGKWLMSQKKDEPKNNNENSSQEKNESKIKKIVAESVKRVLKENMGRFGTLVDNVVEIFNQIYENNKSATDSHVERVKSEGDFKDLETRLAWDVARAAHYWNWDFLPKDRQGFIDATDSQLTTLFKQALRQSNIEY